MLVVVFEDFNAVVGSSVLPDSRRAFRSKVFDPYGQSRRTLRRTWRRPSEFAFVKVKFMVSDLTRLIYFYGSGDEVQGRRQ